jgi:hypothetical protein
MVRTKRPSNRRYEPSSEKAPRRPSPAVKYDIKLEVNGDDDVVDWRACVVPGGDNMRSVILFRRFLRSPYALVKWPDARGRARQANSPAA